MIKWIKQLFCNHSWSYEKCYTTKHLKYEVESDVFLCKKCGKKKIVEFMK